MFGKIFGRSGERNIFRQSDGRKNFGRSDRNFSDGDRTKAGGASPPQTPPRGGRTKAGGATPPQTPPRVKRAGGRTPERTDGRTKKKNEKIKVCLKR